ncbi:phosphatase PAP2 family protein [Bacillus tianshenii]|nr:phosphatase PAP2 family protein [Bacillus tianshenii]
MNNKRKIQPRDILAIAACIGALLLFIDIKLAIEGVKHTAFDQAIQKWVNVYTNEQLESFFVFITNLASWQCIVALVVIAGFLFWHYFKDRTAAIILALSAWGTYELNHLLKAWAQRRRPSINEAVDGVGYSFPSGHAMVGFVFYAMLTYFLLKYLPLSKLGKQIFLGFSGVFIFLIGISRVVLSVHYPTDIAGGFAAGFIIVMLFLWLYRYVKFRSSEK